MGSKYLPKNEPSWMLKITAKNFRTLFNNLINKKMIKANYNANKKALSNLKKKDFLISEKNFFYFACLDD